MEQALLLFNLPVDFKQGNMQHTVSTFNMRAQITPSYDKDQ